MVFKKVWVLKISLYGAFEMIQLLKQENKEIVLEYLEKYHIETTFLIGNVDCFGLDNNAEMRCCGDYYGYFEDDILRGVLPFYNLAQI